jgi:hypothetical protein
MLATRALSVHPVMDNKINTAEPQKPRRRWFQFRLRLLLIVVTLVGSMCGYFGHPAKIAMLADLDKNSEAT